MSIRSQQIPIPDPEGGRAFPQIHKDIENTPRSDPDKLSLSSISSLIVQTPKHMPSGATVIVLDEIDVQAHGAKFFPTPRLKKESPGITKNLWLQQEGIMDFRWKLGHFFLRVSTSLR
jgi:hypothetical protein